MCPSGSSTTTTRSGTRGPTTGCGASSCSPIRASLCVEATGPVAGHVDVDGTVKIHELPDDDIWPVSKRLVDKYIALEHRDAFFANMRTEHRLLFRLTPDVFRASDMRVYRGKRADREYQARQPGS